MYLFPFYLSFSPCPFGNFLYSVFIVSLPSVPQPSFFFLSPLKNTSDAYISWSILTTEFYGLH